MPHTVPSRPTNGAVAPIDASGNVLNVTTDKSSRNRDLDRAAMDAARKWRFNPGRSGGQVVGGDVIVPVNFQNPC